MAEYTAKNIYKSCHENIKAIKGFTNHSSDLVIRELTVAGTRVAMLAVEGMINSFYYSSTITQSLCNAEGLPHHNGPALFQAIYGEKLISPDEKIAYTFDEIFSFLYSGFGIILIDGVDQGIVFGTQGFNIRSISTPSTDENIKGSKEGFIEALKINQTMIRRRIKSPDLVFEPVRLGRKSRTDCSIVYLKSIADPSLLEQIRKRLQKCDFDMVLESSSVKMLFMEKPFSIFPEIGSTERPDTLCAKLYEGKVGMIVDGTPFVLIIPLLFAEHFQSLDDYEYKAIYSNFIRFLKYMAFMISLFLPGLYVALASFHTQAIPEPLLSKIIEGSNNTPYSFFIEALIILLAYEIMREAGLRLPKEIGHTVSIVGGLIIGDAAVTAGIISAPMVLVAALAVISAFVVPALMDSLVILRFMFVILGGLMGLYGIAIGLIILFVNICTKTIFGVPYSSAISPTSQSALKTIFYKSTRQQLASDRVPKLQDMPGAEIKSVYKQKLPLNEYCKYVDKLWMRVLLLFVSVFTYGIGIFIAYVHGLSATALSFGSLIEPVIIGAFAFLVMMSSNRDFDSMTRVTGLFCVLFGTTAFLLAFSALINQYTVNQILFGFQEQINLIYLILGDMALSILTVPFIKGLGKKALIYFLSMELMMAFIIGMLNMQELSNYYVLLTIYLTIFAFSKINCILTIIEDNIIYYWPEANKVKIKPILAFVLFFAAYLLIIA